MQRCGLDDECAIAQDPRRRCDRRISMANDSGAARGGDACLCSYAKAEPNFRRAFTGGCFGLVVIAGHDVLEQAAACDIVRWPVRRPPTLRSPSPPETWRMRRRHSIARPL